MKAIISKKSIFLLLIMLIMTTTTVALANSSEEYIEISNGEDLYNIRYAPDRNYILVADIDMSASENSIALTGEGLWTPISEFSGVLDGNGHSISNMNYDTIYADGNQNSSFIIENTGSVENLTISNSQIVDFSATSGLICSKNLGNISNCVALNNDVIYAYGSGGKIGGLVGINYGSIKKCSNQNTDITFNLSSTGYNYYVGGLSGYNDGGTIEQCFNCSVISVDRPTSPNRFYSGGITGYSVSGSISDCYNNGIIPDRTDICRSAGVLGYSPVDADNLLTNCYSTTETFSIGGKASNCYSLNDNGASTSLTAEQMKKEINFVGFDFEDVWVIDEFVTYPYPQLKSNRQDTAKLVDCIEFNKLPTVTTYRTEDELVVDGTITAYYIDGTQKELAITKEMLSGYDMNTTGTQTVTITYRECTLTYEITVNQRPEVLAAELISQPNQTTFVRGTKLDYTGAVVKIFYKDGTTDLINLTPNNTTGADITKAGTYTVTYTYKGFSQSFEVTVIPVKVTSINIVSLPNETIFIEGQEIDTTGLIVQATYNNGEINVITDYELQYENQAGRQQVTITYQECIAQFSVVFSPRLLESISVTTNPQKTEYYIDEQFDNSGMIVTAYYNNGVSEEIDDYSVGEISKEEGTQLIQIFYNDKSTFITITVKQRTLQSILIGNNPTKMSYFETEEFDPSGMLILAYYDVGDAKVIDDYTISNIITENNKSYVIISYQGVSVQLELHIHNIANVWEIQEDAKCEETGIEVLLCTTCGVICDTREIPVKGHSMKDWSESASPTCEEDGEMSRKCNNCDFVERKAIQALGHDTVTHSKQAPTCTSIGWNEYETCSRCNYSTYNELPLAEHDFEDWQTVTIPTCTSDGEEQRICLDCKKIESRPLPLLGHDEISHIEKTPTCTEFGWNSYITCTRCDYSTYEEVPKTGHEYDAWSTVKKATCTADGLKERVCSDCGNKETKTIISSGHKWNEEYTIDKEASCTENGTKSIHCSVCDIVKEDSMQTVPKTGHEYDAWSTVKKATCTADGLKERVCSDCGNKETKTIISSGHKWNEEYTIDKEASCTENGTKSIHCSVCNIVKNNSQQTIAKKSHNEVTEVEVKATFEYDGKTEGSYCSRCNAVLTASKTITRLSSATLSSAKYTYNGAVRKPTVTVKDSNGVILKEGADYTATYASGRKSVGRYKVTISFKGKYSGTKNLYFTIVPKAPASVTAKLSTSSGGYDDVKFSWKKSTGATGYNVYYKKSSSSKYTFFKATTGTSVTKKNLSDGVKYTFKVVPYYKSGNTKYYSSSQYKTASVTTLKKVTLSSVTKSGTKAKVKWKNINGETGYQISKSTTKKGTNIVSTYKTTSGTYKTAKATKGKKYYYKVRAYKVVDGKKVFGPWSDVKAFTRK